LVNVARIDSHRRFCFHWDDLGRLGFLLGVVTLAVFLLPSNTGNILRMQVIVPLGLLGMWRYSWWMVHFTRAQIYSRVVFPKLRRKAQELWESGWRPKRILYMVTTFNERSDITSKIIGSIAEECRSTGIPAKVFFGIGSETDGKNIKSYSRSLSRGTDLEIFIIHQNVSGKRAAIGLCLRAMSRYGVKPDDLVVFMDGDTCPERGLLEKCLPLFGVLPKLDAVTTDEKAEVVGPGWMQSWLTMRLCQRHIAMQSHSLSKKLLTLTGRLSVFRAAETIQEEFIRLVEADYLDHWLWGRFKFLSGDDKSTVYALLKKPQRTLLLYVPDALACTSELVEGNGFTRLRQNLLRWSGNVLRNGSRCIALGPRQVGPFIWWCMVDQRISMWSTLVGPVTVLILSVRYGPSMFLIGAIEIVVTRLTLSFGLFCYSGKMFVSFPFLLYLNQITNALVKVYLLSRPSKQRWRNRGDQRLVEPEGWLSKYQTVMAAFLTCFYAAVFVLALVFLVTRS
jgi:glycosyltransferase Alg8